MRRLELAHLGCTKLLLDTSDHEFERKVLGALGEMRNISAKKFEGSFA